MHTDNPLHAITCRRLIIAVVLVVCIGAPAPAQNSVVAAGELIDAVVANELSDRVQQRKWMYVIDKREGNRSLRQEQVETKHGPLYRVLAFDGIPLSPNERQQDNARVRRLLDDPSQQSKLKQQYEDDEQKLEKLMRVMPKAFLYDYDGVEGTLVRLKFRPDPRYTPPDYEARVVHSLAGTVLIDSQQRRLAKLSGQLINGVQFGWGILGHLDYGGTIEIGRVQVGPLQWKTALLNVQLSGRLILFKTISKQQYEIRSSFNEVSADLSLSEANELLSQVLQRQATRDNGTADQPSPRPIREFLPE